MQNNSSSTLGGIALPPTPPTDYAPSYHVRQRTGTIGAPFGHSLPSFASVVSKSASRGPPSKFLQPSLSTTSPRTTMSAIQEHDTSPSSPAKASNSPNLVEPPPPADDPSNKSSPKSFTTKSRSSTLSGNSGPAEDEESDTESSDVEIYLNTLGLHDSASRMHVHEGAKSTSNGSGRVKISSPGAPSHPTVTASAMDRLPSTPLRTAENGDLSASIYGSFASRLSPLPLSLQSTPPTQRHQNGPPIGHSKSPQLPPAPQCTTIPLPEDEAENEYRKYQKQQEQHQQSLAPQLRREPSTIDLARLAVAPPVIPSSQSLPAPLYPKSIDITNPDSIDSVVNSRDDMQDEGSGMMSSVSELMLQGQKTPNVYINGLPPHFPEEELYALAAPYGAIKSVRTFTRHVRDSESGYGFVLFESVDAAERCIISLRKYRNLHPTFSKQVHKIPGTQYASIPSASSSAWSTSNAALGPSASFKAKMESLHDPTSTNLYMEGLPMNINDHSLSKLVQPHRIVSSRFFQTRLSNPPRIIAFVRLDSRAGAEEVIERLHGQMVRGGAKDGGSRISVRFADTSEQRELRRQERNGLEADASPGRITIAQAALLNLRGQDFRKSPSINSGANAPLVGSRIHPASNPSPEFTTPVTHIPVIGTQRNAGLEVDYSLAPPSNGYLSGQRSPIGYPYQGGVDPYQLSSALDPNMAALLGSLQLNDTYGSSALDYASPFGQPSPLSMGGQDLGYFRSPPASTRTGYTAAEEYIMRAHAETAALAQAQAQAQHFHTQQQPNVERRRPAPLDLRRGREDGFVDGYRSQALGGGLDSPSASSMSMGSVAHPATVSLMNGMNDDDFRSAGMSARQPYRSVNDSDDGRGLGGSIHNPKNNIGGAHLMRGGSMGASLYPNSQMQRLTLSPLLTTTLDEQQHGVHMRSTTLPQQRSSGPQAQQRGHYQHNSVSIPSGPLRTPQHANTRMMPGRPVETNLANVIYESEQQGEESSDGLTNPGSNTSSSFSTSSAQRLGSGAGSIKGSSPYGSGVFGDLGFESSDDPTLISPTLTYSSQTPSTLSPATPFFGSFGQADSMTFGGVDKEQQKGMMKPSSLRAGVQ